MLKKVSVNKLKPGVFIQCFDCGWMGHPFLFSSKLVTNQGMINRIIDWGIREVYIDTNKGIDIEDAPPLKKHRRLVENEMRQMAEDEVTQAINQIPVREEIIRARGVKSEATRLVRRIMEDITEDKIINPEKTRKVVAKIDESISRNRDALILLLRIRNKDNYTFSHSVGVGALMISFCRALGLDQETAHEVGMGAILHDIGKMKIPTRILNKPSRLTDREYSEMKKHVILCNEILLKTKEIPENSICIAMQHHERYDGTGYPDGLKGSEICLGGQMAAIVDVFDAITSNRCYREGLDTVEGLRRIYEWSRYHFDQPLAHKFIKLMGIYPVGTVVELASGLIGVVIESTEVLLRPVVTALYNKKKGWPISPRMINLSKKSGSSGSDRIVSYQSAKRYNIDPMKVLGLQ